MRRELPTPVRLVGFAALLAVGFAAAYGVGATAAPAVPAPAPPAGEAHDDPVVHGEPATGGHVEGHDGAAVSAAPPGLSMTQDGFTLHPVTTTLPAGAAVPFGFTVTGPDGRLVTEYRPTHERDLHLVVVRRDLAGFQHVHPALGPDGTWTVPLDLSAAGTYRVLADFAPRQGEPVVLGTDVHVAGAFTPVPLPEPATTAEVDGYTVTIAGDPHPGQESTLTFDVSRDGRPVTGLEPYLGAFGHLVALRAGDLAYLHTHPGGTASAGATGGPAIEFATTFPTAGEYRLHLDFQVGGQVRTATATVVVPAGEEHP